MDYFKAIRAFPETVRESFRSSVTALKALFQAGIPERFWLSLFFLGLLLGLSTKTVAREWITIGHDDYRLLPAERLYDLNASQDAVLSQGGGLTQPEAKKTSPACSLYDE